MNYFMYTLHLSRAEDHEFHSLVGRLSITRVFTEVTGSNPVAKIGNIYCDDHSPPSFRKLNHKSRGQIPRDSTFSKA